MHRSKWTALLIDCSAGTFEAGAKFWAGALGLEVEPFDRQQRYVRLRGAALDIFAQRVPDEEVGLHLDIETDDVDAEVRRLEALGARRKRKVQSWWVMEDPAGHAFCVVEPQSANWPEGAREWP